MSSNIIPTRISLTQFGCARTPRTFVFQICCETRHGTSSSLPREYCSAGYTDASRLATFSRPEGKHHDLGPMFERLNARYFENSLVKPRLGWSTRVWRTQLGCFDPALEQIVINRQLDRKNVPEYIVAYVLYHEMLHLKHPMRFARCRRESHSPQFRAEEKKFQDYDQAMRFLKTFPSY